MALFRLPLWFNKHISFYKLLGSGRNGTFDKHPDWQQWGILSASDKQDDSDTIQQLYGSFISGWLKLFSCETWTIFLSPTEGHGQWDGKSPFGALTKQTDHEGMIAVLTRATIRLSKLNAFWKNVDSVAMQMNNAKGFITSFGIGEIPYIKQATFSIWESRDDMKNFAYQLHQHAEVIRKTRKENWYSEEMFVRFRIVKTIGTLRGINPLAGKL